MFKVGDVVRTKAAAGMEKDGRTTIAIITGSPDSPYGYWFHTNAINPRGCWRDLANYELAL
jgi:hypothetical protein